MATPTEEILNGKLYFLCSIHSTSSAAISIADVFELSVPVWVLCQMNQHGKNFIAKILFLKKIILAKIFDCRKKGNCKKGMKDRDSA